MSTITKMANKSTIKHNKYGNGVAVLANRTEDNSLRIFIVWDDIELSDVICGWYVFDEKEFVIGK